MSAAAENYVWRVLVDGERTNLTVHLSGRADEGVLLALRRAAELHGIELEPEYAA